MTCFLRDKESHTSLFAILESFGSCSGLRVNQEKSEILALGSNILHEKYFNDHKMFEVIKILGVYFGYDEKQRNDLNFRQTLKSIKKSIHMWKWRNLSILVTLLRITIFSLHEDPYVTISPEQCFFIMVVVHSLPSDWKTIIRSSVGKNDKRPIPHTPYIKLNCGSFPISGVTSKQIYDSFLGKKQIPPTAQQKISDKYSDTTINWRKVYSLPFLTTLDSKLREFQYKFLTTLSLRPFAISKLHFLQLRTRILRTFTLSLQSVF